MKFRSRNRETISVATDKLKNRRKNVSSVLKYKTPSTTRLPDTFGNALKGDSPPTAQEYLPILGRLHRRVSQEQRSVGLNIYINFNEFLKGRDI